MINLEDYRKPALQFSGGKDSLACLYLLRDQLDKLTVYWVDAGDGCPETHAVIEAVRPWIPHFVVVKSDSRKWRENNGIPSDVVPSSCHPMGVAYGMGRQRISNKFDCCIHNLMLPMHQRMLADGVDLVIRGTKLADTGVVPADGPTEDYTVCLPIKDWSHEDVFAYLKEVGAPTNPVYDFFKGISAPECLSCTAWWDDGKAAYLKERHPAQYEAYQGSLREIAFEIQKHVGDLVGELGQET